MKKRVPNLERCKRLKEAGYPQEKSKFYWVTDHADVAWVEYSQSEFYNSFDIIAAAPIVTELVEECLILMRASAKWGERIRLVRMNDGNWYAEPFYHDGIPLCDVRVADTLPNALTDLWMELKGEKA